MVAAPRKPEHHFDDAGWTLAMALGWIAEHSAANVENPARGFGFIEKAATDRLTRHLRSGRLRAFRLVEHGELRQIAPEVWSMLQLTVTRKILSGSGNSYLTGRKDRMRT